MRLALLGLAALTVSQTLLAQDTLRVAQSPVTLRATFSRPGEEQDPVDRPYDNDVDVKTRVDAVRYGNSQVLRTFLAGQTPAITDITGWALVAVWANWPDTGNSYKFFARKKPSDFREIPASVLGLELTDPYVSRKTTSRESVVVAGSNTHKALATVTLGAITVTDGDTNSDDPRATAAGITNGVLFGTGTYVRPASADAAIYRPAKDSFVGYGQAGSDVLTVTLTIGASNTISAGIFSSNTPTSPAAGPEATSLTTSLQIGGGLLFVGDKTAGSSTAQTSLSDGSILFFRGDTIQAGPIGLSLAL